MFPANFEYHRPGSVDEAIGLLGEHGEDGRVLAGGHSLIPMMKLRFAQPGHLIDLRDVSEVKGIDIGAVTPEEIALSVLADIVRERRLGSLAEAPRIEDVLEEISGEAPSLS